MGKIHAGEAAAIVMRTGVFGGTFDPIHIGHLVAAQNAQHAAALDRILFVIANQPWQKEGGRTVTNADLRYLVVEELLRDIPHLEACDIEIRRGGPSYTYDTLLVLKELYPTDELFLIVGADAAESMATWERAELLSDLADLIVLNRYGYPTPEGILNFPEPIAVEMPWLDISSTDLRDRVKTKRPLQFLLPEVAIRAIERYGLYS
ncbi:MAG: nicotinate-nucleotide adenylyltransferase [Ferrimicrobium sp.]